MKKILFGMMVLIFFAFPVQAKVYLANPVSLSTHPLPDWYSDAKFGIFIHWGLFSVPAFGPPPRSYSEWYLNDLRINNSETRYYHDQTYGADFKYEDFVPLFYRATQDWNAQEWADIFAQAGARYVVMVTKHHDGFTLWPSIWQNPKIAGFNSSRDYVGELGAAVREQNMYFGTYYSGGYDWSFEKEAINLGAGDFASWMDNAFTSQAYATYVGRQMRELVDRYHPDILWNDIIYPPKDNSYRTIAYYYNHVPWGVINDRWLQLPPLNGRMLNQPPTKQVINGFVAFMLKLFTGSAVLTADQYEAQVDEGLEGVGGSAPPGGLAYDFATPEYASFKTIHKKKWETCRGIGHSFGYNQFETDKDYMTAHGMIHLLIDIVSKNGNLLLNVGPRADGSIPDGQLRCILGVGAWLKKNGEAIYGTRPWFRFDGLTGTGETVRFTTKPGKLYVILLSTPKTNPVIIKNLIVNQNVEVKLLSPAYNLPWKQQGWDLAVTLPTDLPDSEAHVLSISSQSN